MKKTFTFIFGYCFFVLIANSETINPFPCENIDRQVANEWNFDDDNTNDWGADSDCIFSFKNNNLSVTFGDSDPHFSTPDVKIREPVLVEFRTKSKAPGNGQFFWSTTELGKNARRSGNIDIDWMCLTSLTYHPLEIIETKTLSDKTIAIITNHSEKSVTL